MHFLPTLFLCFRWLKNSAAPLDLKISRKTALRWYYPDQVHRVIRFCGTLRPVTDLPVVKDAVFKQKTPLTAMFLRARDLWYNPALRGPGPSGRRDKGRATASIDPWIRAEDMPSGPQLRQKMKSSGSPNTYQFQKDRNWGRPNFHLAMKRKVWAVIISDEFS